MKIIKAVLLVFLLTGMLFGGTAVVHLYIRNTQDQVVVTDRQYAMGYSMPAISEETRFYPWTQFDRSQNVCLKDMADDQTETYLDLMTTIQEYLSVYGLYPEAADLEANTWLEGTYIYVDQCPLLIDVNGSRQKFYVDFCMEQTQTRLISVHYYDVKDEETLITGLSQEEEKQLLQAWDDYYAMFGNIGGEYAEESVSSALYSLISRKLYNGEYGSLVSGNEIVLVLETETEEYDALGDQVFLEGIGPTTILLYYSPSYQWIHGITIYESK